MFGKKYLLILGALAVVSVGVSMAISVFFRPASPAGGGAAGPTSRPATKSEALLAGLHDQPAPEMIPEREKMSELIKDLRMRIADYQRKRRKLDDRERKLALAEGNLKLRAKELEKLSMQLEAPLSNLKDAIAGLEKAQQLVGQQERTALQRVAAVYERMDPVQASTIFSGMCENSQTDDVVKILYYMSERISAKVLGEITDKSLAAKLTAGMKTIREVKQKG